MMDFRNILISEGEIHLDGNLLFSNEEKDFKLFGKSIYKHYGILYTKFYKMSPLSKLGFLASELLLKDQDLSGLDNGKISLVLANSSSSLHTDRIYQETMKSLPSPAVFVYTLPNIVIGEICIRNGFKGEGVFFIQENYDKGFIFEYAEELIASGRSTLCLAGWIEMNMEGEYLADLSLLK